MVKRKSQFTITDAPSPTIQFVLKHLTNLYFRNFSSKPVAGPLWHEASGMLSVKLRRLQGGPARVCSSSGPAALVLLLRATLALGTEETRVGVFFPGGPALHLGLPGAPGRLLCGQSEVRLRRLERMCSRAAAQRVSVGELREDGPSP